MPPLQMTRAEYEQKYGTAPVLIRSNVDTSPAPLRMTRAEYDAKYGIKPPPSVVGTLLSPLREGFSGLKTLYGGGEQGIAMKLQKDITQGAENIQKGDVFGSTKAGFRVAGDIAGTIYAPVGATIGATGIGKFFDYIGALSQRGGKYNVMNALTDMKMVQDFVMESPELEEDFGRALNLILSKADTGKIEPSTAIPRTIEQFKTIPRVVDTYRVNRNTKLIQNTANEIGAVENKYVKGRNANLYSKDAGADSRLRIAQSGVLKNSTDESGMVRTRQSGGAVETYKAMTVKPAENVVRVRLAQEGATAKLSDVEAFLTDIVNKSSLRGADLKVALNGVKREVSGLRLKADGEGNISLAELHDAKINTTNNINYFTPPETATYRKSIARGYKELVENNSKLNIKQINGELAKYYDDIARLQRLDGARVTGGKLGKYTAQISGNIIGGAFGSIGGPIGVALGTIIGGETAAFLKGQSMSKAFTNKAVPTPPKSPILEKAVAQSKSFGNLNAIYKNPSPIKTNVIP